MTQPQERTVNLHAECLEGFYYSPWMASPDSSESVDWIETREDGDLDKQIAVTTEQTTN